MTASAPSSPRPGRAAPAGRPAGALLVMLLVALLTALPCAGQATAAGGSARQAPAPVSAVSVVSVVEATVVALPVEHSGHSGHSAHSGRAAKASEQHPRFAEEQGHWILCTADGQPQRNNGCSSHPYCAQDAQLPNPPPQPQPAVSPLVASAPEALPRVVPAGLLDGPHPAPDLHELQVHRS
ncbi:hypothetical protein [Kitasatospora sp. SUK 42]|uniref:hypothetical protein n=1 Tax=Kitasatospora sp. SUK 42 TaxID=1588882 RepID=UPI0018CBD40D|nr:hypothetical protein [Kitasatospora sp. SUK 42]MBV2153420.1 hypothetical protein [Kitasatospora sp. SUK 42]